MDPSTLSASGVTTSQRVALKRAQVLAEMNETIHSLSRIESVLDEINRCIRPIDVESSCLNDSKSSSGDALMKVSNVASNDSTISASRTMEQLMIELEKWEDI